MGFKTIHAPQKFYCMRTMSPSFEIPGSAPSLCLMPLKIQPTYIEVGDVDQFVYRLLLCTSSSYKLIYENLTLTARKIDLHFIFHHFFTTIDTCSEICPI